MQTLIPNNYRDASPPHWSRLLVPLVLRSLYQNSTRQSHISTIFDFLPLLLYDVWYDSDFGRWQFFTNGEPLFAFLMGHGAPGKRSACMPLCSSTCLAVLALR